MNDYNIHPDFMKYKNMKLPLNPVMLPVINFFMTRAFYRTPAPNGLTEARHTIKGYEGASVKLTVLSPVNQDKSLPALVYFHGGAFAIQAATIHKRMLFRYAGETPCTVIFVDYRLLPKARFPMGLEDCYAAYKWVIENNEMLGIDPDHIAVGGDSAGGKLTISVCLLARERKIPMPCFQMLIYPVTDERQETPSMKEFTDTPLWNSKLNAKMWRMYRGGGLPDRNEYASPAEAASLVGMPPAYVEVSEYDPLRDEGIAFVKSLRANGVPAELHQTRRTVHGFEIAEKNEIVLESVTRRIEKLRAALT